MEDRETKRRKEYEIAKWKYELYQKGHLITVSSATNADLTYPWAKEELLKQLIVLEAYNRESNEPTGISYPSAGPYTVDDENSLWAYQKLHEILKLEKLVSELFSDEEEQPSIFDAIFVKKTGDKLVYTIRTAHQYREKYSERGKDKDDYGPYPDMFIEYIEETWAQEVERCGYTFTKLGRLADDFHTDHEHDPRFKWSKDTVKNWAIERAQQGLLFIEPYAVRPGQPRSIEDCNSKANE